MTDQDKTPEKGPFKNITTRVKKLAKKYTTVRIADSTPLQQLQA